MVKTFREGRQEKLKRWKVFSCNICGWIGAADKDSYKYSSQYNEDHYYLECPYCHHSSAYEVKDSTIRNEVLQKVLS